MEESTSSPVQNMSHRTIQTVVTKRRQHRRHTKAARPLSPTLLGTCLVVVLFLSYSTVMAQTTMQEYLQGLATDAEQTHSSLSQPAQRKVRWGSGRRVPPHEGIPMQGQGGTASGSTHSEAEEKRRDLLAFSWRFMGLNLDFNQGPTLAALNASFFRYDSVSAKPDSFDWRKTPFTTPIQVQYDCSSCWAMAAADTVAMASAIAANSTAVPASTQQICDCSGHTCCSGGWPENAFAYMVQKGNISATRDYNYWAMDGRECVANTTYTVAGSVTGWERVPAFSQEALMKAVNMQPVLVYISASSPDFQRYSSPPPGDPRGVNIYDGNCTVEVNHAVVVVGYNVRLKYWILKNTWPAGGWGDGGYMYIKMQDGLGKCGMLSVNPLYPVNFPRAPNPVTVHQDTDAPTLANDTAMWWDTWKAPVGYNPCAGVINPCGNGTCFSDNGVARCKCSNPYVEVVGVPTSKCVHKSPCSVSLINPCAAGSCMDVGDGSYLCGCPTGYAVGFRVDGAPTCVPVNDVLARTYIANYGDTCERLQRLYSISKTTFSTLNPYLDCSQAIVPGVVVTLQNSTGVACTQTYAIRPDDTCELLAYFIGTKKFSRWLDGSNDLSSVPLLSKSTPGKWSVTAQDRADLMALNPALNCSSLMTSQQICVSTITSSKSADPVTCGLAYTAQYGDTCNGLMKIYGLKSKAFSLLNPGFNCNSNGGRISPGVRICISEATNNGPVVCSEFYTVQQGDTCAHIWNAANLSNFQFFFINPGLQCQTPYLYMGRQVCIDSPALANISDPNYLTYPVQVNDTWGTLQSHFSRQCMPWSISVPRIAQQNGIEDWVNHTLEVGSTLIIPCIPGIGASCGCVPSLPVCGANLISYDSFCDAQCNFALPAVDGACSTCQLACQGRMGKAPNPTTACAANYVCPWPQWAPPLEYAQQIFSTSPQCSYRTKQCLNVCSMYASNFGSGTNSTCVNTCMACNRVPCSGSGEVVTKGTGYCPLGCDSVECNPYGFNTCITDCSYWRTTFGVLNP